MAEKDPVIERLSENLGTDYSVLSVYRDDEMGLYLIQNKALPKTSAIIHLHDIKEDIGTTYTFGANNELRGNIGNIQHLNDDQLLDAIGEDLLNELYRLTAETPSPPSETEASATHEMSINLPDKIQAWLDFREWDDEIELDEENDASRLTFNYEISDQAFDVYIETDGNSDTIQVFIYAPFNVLPAKSDEFNALLATMNVDIWSGAFIKTTDGRICWRHIVNFADTDPSVKTINNMFRYGAEVFANWFETISTVALTKKTTNDALALRNAD